jgi:lysosomal alpha-mannosidase
VETSFFWRWWSEQESNIQSLVTELVNAGQLEFIGGGWCMNDEATAHYSAIIDQMSFGLKKLRDTFGKCGIPKVAWQIDPFGHSREQADLFVQMGMDGLFFGRLDYREKAERFENQTSELVWLTSPALKETKEKLFTSILYDVYDPPSGFCWDISYDNDPLIDDPSLHDYNIDVLGMDFVNFARKQKESYPTNNIIVSMGMDFQYQLAHMWFKNIDKLINYVNTHLGEKEKVHLMYSTPSCYLKALNDEGLQWTSKSDDFFPYASDPHAYWTGYFTSRPTSKRLIRVAGQWLQFAKHLTAIAFVNSIDKVSYTESIILP